MGRKKQFGRETTYEGRSRPAAGRQNRIRKEVMDNGSEDASKGFREKEER